MNLLLTEDWDIFVDGTGQLAVTPSIEYDIAQQVANEIKLFEGEGWFDRSQGMPHFTKTFEANPNWSLIKQIFTQHVEAVDGVIESEIDFYLDKDRALHGVIYTTTTKGTLANVISNLLY